MASLEFNGLYSKDGGVTCSETSLDVCVEK